PESFAQDIRRLIDHHKIRISLWNALTTVAVLYRPTGTPRRIVELLNYAEEPLQVQVQVKGSFRSIRFESPEQGCCESLKSTVRDGFTEFVVPSLNLDRKSTRLNSSHVAISYAVFCVKKKKQVL